MSYFAGIDSGSATTKVVVISRGGAVRGTGVVRTAADLSGAARRAFERALERAGVRERELEAVWATGFGRNSVGFASGSRTELDCHARGVRHLVEGAVTILDIGGQDTKVIRLGDDGRRISHKMNRKCAAGTGSFLEDIAHRLGVEVTDLEELASRWGREFELGSFCTVFTGTEILTAIRRGVSPADLARAAYKSVVNRVLEMDRFDGRVVATGGVVAHNPMVVTLLEDKIHTAVEVPPYCQEIGALGAALAARAASESAPEVAR